MIYLDLVRMIADILKGFDTEKPVHKTFQPGIGPFGEPQLVRKIAQRLTSKGKKAHVQRTPDVVVCDGQCILGIEFKTVRPFGDNGRKAEHWSVNVLHPYPSNGSLLADALKLTYVHTGIDRKCLCVIGYEHDPARMSLEPLIQSFELLARQVMNIPLGEKLEERRVEIRDEYVGGHVGKGSRSPIRYVNIRCPTGAGIRQPPLPCARPRPDSARCLRVGGEAPEDRAVHQQRLRMKTGCFSDAVLPCGGGCVSTNSPRLMNDRTPLSAAGPRTPGPASAGTPGPTRARTPPRAAGRTSRARGSTGRRAWASAPATPRT